MSSGRRQQQELAPCATSHGRHLPARALLRCPISHSLSLTTVRGILIKCKQRISSGCGRGRGSDFLARLNLLIKERATVEGGGGEWGWGVTGLATCQKPDFPATPTPTHSFSLSLAHNSCSRCKRSSGERREEGRAAVKDMHDRLNDPNSSILCYKQRETRETEREGERAKERASEVKYPRPAATAQLLL